MIRALGYSQVDDFHPHEPGRLCRGRERWIAPWELEPGADEPELSQLVVTGAAFEDDSARDALRGLPAAGVDVADLIAALFPKRRLLAFVEDGHPADIRDGAFGVELYDGYRAGGRTVLPQVRWYLTVDKVDALRALADDLVQERISGFVVIDKKADPAALVDKVFPLVGLSTQDSPPARYNPAALPDLLEVVDAVVLLHRDKHGPVLGVYSDEPIEGAVEVLRGVAAKSDCLLVPFAIPPMLARWDRALHELRQGWERDHTEPFPVPRSTQPSHWESRRDRRRRGRDDRDGADDAPPDDPTVDDPSDLIDPEEQALADALLEDQRRIDALLADDDLLQVGGGSDPAT